MSKVLLFLCSLFCQSCQKEATERLAMMEEYAEYYYDDDDDVEEEIVDKDTIENCDATE